MRTCVRAECRRWWSEVKWEKEARNIGRDTAVEVGGSIVAEPPACCVSGQNRNASAASRRNPHRAVLQGLPVFFSAAGGINCWRAMDQFSGGRLTGLCPAFHPARSLLPRTRCSLHNRLSSLRTAMHAKTLGTDSTDKKSFSSRVLSDWLESNL